jgi:hypothetical protein
MTPFNLEQALAGKPFTNDKGWTVEDWHYFRNALLPICVKWKGLCRIFEYKESELFMLPEKKKVWIVVYRNRFTGIDTIVTENKIFADSYANDFGKDYLETIEKEYEL